MNFRFTAMLFLVVLLLVGGLLIAVLIDDKPSADAVLLGSLAGLKLDDIDVVEISRTEPTEEKLVFARVGKGRWELRDGRNGRLNEAPINRVIETLLRLKPTLTADISSNPALHGLDKPTLKVTLRSGTQKQATLNLGDTTIGGDKAVTYVSTSERPGTPVAVKRSDVADLFKYGSKDGRAGPMAKWTSDYRLQRLLGVDLFDVVGQAKALKISSPDKVLALSRHGTDWKFDSPPSYGAVDIAGDPAPNPDKITGLRPLVVAFQTFSATSPDDFIEEPGPLEQYGLGPNDPKLRIELVPMEGPPDVIFVGKKVDGPPPVRYFVQVQGEQPVIKVASDRVPAILNTLADPSILQDRTLVKDLDVPRIDAAEVTSGGSKSVLRKVPVGSEVSWVLYGGQTDPQIAGNAWTSFLTDVSKPRVALEVLTASADAMFAPNEIKAEVKLWIDGFTNKVESKDGAIPPEPKLKGDPTLTLLFGKVEGDKAYVRRTQGGAKVDYIVPAHLEQLASKKRTDFFSLKFKEFPTNQARRLTFNRGAEIFELERTEKGETDWPTGKWTFAKPDALKGQVADTDAVAGSVMSAGLLGNIATLSAASVVAESPTEAELKAMGLDPAAPRMSITVGLPEDSIKERVYHFGNETADKAYVHFREPGKPIVYLVPRVVLDPFFTANLRDKTPYRFDTKSVTRITLHGWKKKLGQPTVLELVREGDNWIVKGMPPQSTDSLTMMNLLNHCRAPKPVAVVGAQKPEHGFDAAKDGADPLEVTFFGEKGPIVALNIGNETDGGASVFVWNSVTNQVITLPAALYRQFKDGPDVFKK